MYGQYWGYELLTSVNDLHLVDEKKDLLALSKEARCWALRTRPLKMIYKLTKTRYMLMKTNRFMMNWLMIIFHEDDFGFLMLLCFLNFYPL